MQAKQRQPEAQKELLAQLEPKIRFWTRRFPMQEREEVSQLLRVKVLESLDTFEIRRLSLPADRILADEYTNPLE